MVNFPPVLSAEIDLLPFLKGHGDQPNSCASRPCRNCYKNKGPSSERRTAASREAWQTAGTGRLCCLAPLKTQDLFQQTLPSSAGWLEISPHCHSKHTTRNSLDCHNTLIRREPVRAALQKRPFFLFSRCPHTFHLTWSGLREDGFKCRVSGDSSDAAVC